MFVYEYNTWHYNEIVCTIIMITSLFVAPIMFYIDNINVNVVSYFEHARNVLMVFWGETLSQLHIICDKQQNNDYYIYDGENVVFIIYINILFIQLNGVCVCGTQKK